MSRTEAPKLCEKSGLLDSSDNLSADDKFINIETLRDNLQVSNIVSNMKMDCTDPTKSMYDKSSFRNDV